MKKPIISEKFVWIFQKNTGFTVTSMEYPYPIKAIEREVIMEESCLKTSTAQGSRESPIMPLIRRTMISPYMRLRRKKRIHLKIQT